MKSRGKAEALLEEGGKCCPAVLFIGAGQRVVFPLGLSSLKTNKDVKYAPLELRVVIDHYDGWDCGGFFFSFY